jgi:hypothetical protein
MRSPLDGQSPTSPATLAPIIGTMHPDDTVPITWIDQSGGQRRATMTLAPPASPQSRAADSANEATV